MCSTNEMIIILGARSGTSILFRCLERTDFNGDLPCYRRRNNDSEHRQFRAINLRLRKANCHLPRVTTEARGLWVDMLDRGVEIVKEPHFTWVWPTWLKEIPDFRNYKYIWMQRNMRDRAHSLLKYQTIQGYKDRSLDKCFDYLRAMDAATRELISCTPNHLIVQFDDFVNLRKTTTISRFVERELDTSLVDNTQVSSY